MSNNKIIARNLVVVSLQHKYTHIGNLYDIDNIEHNDENVYMCDADGVYKMIINKEHIAYMYANPCDPRQFYIILNGV